MNMQTDTARLMRSLWNDPLDEALRSVAADALMDDGDKRATLLQQSALGLLPPRCNYVNGTRGSPFIRFALANGNLTILSPCRLHAIELSPSRPSAELFRVDVARINVQFGGQSAYHWTCGRSPVIAREGLCVVLQAGARLAFRLLLSLLLEPSPPIETAIPIEAEIIIQGELYRPVPSWRQHLSQHFPDLLGFDLEKSLLAESVPS